MACYNELLILAATQRYENTFRNTYLGKYTVPLLLHDQLTCTRHIVLFRKLLEHDYQYKVKTLSNLMIKALSLSWWVLFISILVLWLYIVEPTSFPGAHIPINIITKLLYLYVVTIYILKVARFSIQIQLFNNSYMNYCLYKVVVVVSCVSKLNHVCNEIYIILFRLCAFVLHDDIIKWKHFPRNWPFVRGIHRSRWIPHTKASDAELWYFLWFASE